MLIATKLPIEIINKILIYVGELNNEVIIEQYNATNCFYKINFYIKRIFINIFFIKKNKVLLLFL